MSDPLEQRIIEWDQMIRGGKSDLVKLEMKQLFRSAVPRNLWFDVADLCRRLQLHFKIIYWLYPLVRPKSEYDEQASQRELALYGLGLSRIGAFNEAKEIFSKVSAKEVPMVDYYKASLYISHWDYGEALLCLKKLIQNPHINSYSRLIGKINLCSSLSTLGKTQEALGEIDLLLPELDSYPLLKSNLYDVQSLAYYNAEEFGKSEDSLTKSSELLSSKNSQYFFFLTYRKKLIELSRKNKMDVQDQMNLMALKKEALHFHLWEVCREIDFFIAKKIKNDDLFLKIYFGTYFVKYRENILKRYGWKNPVPQSFQLEWGATGLFYSSVDDQTVQDIRLSTPLDGYQTPHLHSKKILVLSDGILTNDKKEFEAPVFSGLKKKFISHLASDSYRPFHWGEIFATVYPRENIDLESSLNRVKYLLHASRQELQKNKLPLQIIFTKNQIRLESLKKTEGAPSFYLQVAKKPPSEKLIKKSIPKLPAFSELKQKLDHRFFSNRDFALSFGLTLRSAQRVLAVLLKKKIIQKTFKSTRAKYKIRNPQ